MGTSRKEPGYDVSVSIKQADIEIGAVEIKDATTDNRVSVDQYGRVSVKHKTYREEVKLYTSTYTTTGLSIADTAKPTTPQISYTHTIVETTTTNNPAGHFDGTNKIQIKRVAFKTVLTATNTDTVDHTLYYEIQVDGSVVASGNFTVPAGASASQTITYAVVPSDNDVVIDIYLWADAANVITVDESSDVGVGSESTSEQEVISISVLGDASIYSSFVSTGTASYTWTLRSATSNVRIGYYTNDDLVVVAPLSDVKIMLNVDTAGEIARCIGITLLLKEW